MAHPPWMLLHPEMTAEHLGLLPSFLDEDDPRKAREQFNERYAHGGGWRPTLKFEMLNGFRLKYPGDPVLKPVAICRLRDETIILYPADVVAILQRDGSFEAARMD